MHANEPVPYNLFAICPDLNFIQKDASVNMALQVFATYFVPSEGQLTSLLIGLVCFKSLESVSTLHYTLQCLYTEADALEPFPASP